MERLLGYLGRRWKWLVLGGVIGALLGVGSTIARSDAWLADSLVVLTDARIPSEDFSAVATAIFPTEPVLGAVISELNIDETPGSLISSGALQVRATPGGLAVRVVARTQDEALSIGLANEAATALARVGEENGLGEIAQFPGQGARKEKEPVAFAALAGMLLGIALVGAVLALRFVATNRGRREEERADADVTVRVRVTPPTADADRGPVVAPGDALEGLVRGFLGGANGEPIPGVVLDDGPSGWAVLAVADELNTMAGPGQVSPTFAWSSASGPLPRLSDRVAVIAPHGAGARLDDVRRSLADGRPGAFVALVVVSAPDLS